MAISEIALSNQIRKLSKILNNLASRQAAKLGLTVPQGMVIREIYEEPKTMSQISQAIGLSCSTTTGIVDRLEREGYVKRIRDDSDRRVVWLHREEKLDGLIRQVRMMQDQFYVQIFADLSADERAQVAKTMTMLIDKLEKKDGEGV
ncbi:MarR family winged helix-turn-helix transcriptional regulator [Heliophilum fasciatum]|uniref:MarR family transcriptional regulator n=1 Tax=Heliophilum fasciatum TaxID=35700 RepID=A0A4R2S7C1_9FIRM|nr:MarR family transcriptional regulator [Heliophilum fasciatum]MCW2277298.1 DNA-binding MarR family transcriptional regulator [Heliophilum fasciatum]TCP67135.1 MarR family transcriptional regulator [Heliophilum fasciatum]